MGLMKGDARSLDYGSHEQIAPALFVGSFRSQSHVRVFHFKL